MPTHPLHRHLTLVTCILCAVPLAASAQAPTLQQRSVARAGLSAAPATGNEVTGITSVLQSEGWRAMVGTDETQWVKGGIIGAAIMGVGGYALLNGANGLGDNSWSQGEILRGSAILAGLGFVIGSLIGSGYKK